NTQVDGKIFSIEHLVEYPPEQWLEHNLRKGAKLGYDPWLHTSDQAEKLRKACAIAGADLVAADSNPVDALWRGRPTPAPARGRGGATCSGGRRGDAARAQARRRNRVRQA